MIFAIFTGMRTRGAYTLLIVPIFSFVTAACQTEDEASSANLDSANAASTNKSSTSSGQSSASLAIAAPVRLSINDIQTIDSETGWTNTSGKTIFVQGRVQIFQVRSRCANADLEVRWSSTAPWLRLQAFFVERVSYTESGGGQPGNGISVPTQFYLPPGGSVRVNFGTNSDCRDPVTGQPDGILYLGGHAEGSIPESQIFDWSYSTIN